MSSNLRKVKKYRGHKTHGGGAMKKRRGAGSRGGRGLSGRGKRADVKKPSVWKIKDYYGSPSFTSHRPRPVAVNVSDLVQQLSLFEENGFAKKTSQGYEINLSSAGIDKLLGSGAVSQTFIVTVASASPRAVEKIVSAGGSVHTEDDQEESEQ